MESPRLRRVAHPALVRRATRAVATAAMATPSSSTSSPRRHPQPPLQQQQQQQPHSARRLLLPTAVSVPSPSSSTPSSFADAASVSSRADRYKNPATVGDATPPTGTSKGVPRPPSHSQQQQLLLLQAPPPSRCLHEHVQLFIYDSEKQNWRTESAELQLQQPQHDAPLDTRGTGWRVWDPVSVTWFTAASSSVAECTSSRADKRRRVTLVEDIIQACHRRVTSTGRLWQLTSPQTYLNLVVPHTPSSAPSSQVEAAAATVPSSSACAPSISISSYSPRTIIQNEVAAYSVFLSLFRPFMKALNVVAPDSLRYSLRAADLVALVDYQPFRGSTSSSSSSSVSSSCWKLEILSNDTVHSDARPLALHRTPMHQETIADVLAAFSHYSFVQSQRRFLVEVSAVTHDGYVASVLVHTNAAVVEEEPPRTLPGILLAEDECSIGRPPSPPPQRQPQLAPFGMQNHGIEGIRDFLARHHHHHPHATGEHSVGARRNAVASCGPLCAALCLPRLHL